MPKLKISTFLAALAATSLSAMVLAVSPADAQTRELRYTDWGPDKGIRADALKWFDQELRERTNNELGLEFYWGGVLLGPSNAMQGIASGAADIGSATPPYEPGVIVSWEAADVPQISDEWVGMRAAYDLMTTHPAALDEFKAQGLHYVSNMTTGPMQLVSRDPIKTVADIQNKKIRATGSFVDAFDAVGATAVSLSNSESYQALSTGAVDGTSGYWYAIPAYKWGEVAKYVTELNLGQFLAFGIVMNDQVYESLTDSQKKVVDGLGEDFIDHMAERVYRARVGTREQIRTGSDDIEKMEIFEPSEDLRQELLVAAEEAGMDWIGEAETKSLPAEELLQKFRDRIKHYEDLREKNGYPWGSE
ncbi:MAG: C4-dicarboxylate TRAP transporter substrate-binding protein [Rhodovibrionaceae bacterium]